MPAPNVTFRRARGALSLLISGALREIEGHYGADNTDAIMTETVRLFDQLADEMDGWEIEPSRGRRLEALHDNLQEWLAKHDPKEEHPRTEFARELLAKHDLMP
jgi:hypothetical protein